jgi:ParB family chromosome partitioning protein
MGHARALLALRGDEQVQAARHIVLRALSVRETERYVKGLAAGRFKRSPVRSDANVSELERSLGETLGTRVEVHHDHKGKGKLVIHYTSLDELDGIIAHIK